MAVVEGVSSIITHIKCVLRETRNVLYHCTEVITVAVKEVKRHIGRRIFDILDGQL